MTSTEGYSIPLSATLDCVESSPLRSHALAREVTSGASNTAVIFLQVWEGMSLSVRPYRQRSSRRMTPESSGPCGLIRTLILGR